MLNSLAVCFCSTLWSKISNALKRLGFRSHNFLAQLLSETSRACTIRVRRSTLERLWNELGSHAGLHHRNRRSRTAGEERISGCGEPVRSRNSIGLKRRGLQLRLALAAQRPLRD